MTDKQSDEINKLIASGDVLNARPKLDAIITEIVEMEKSTTPSVMGDGFVGLPVEFLEEQDKARAKWSTPPTYCRIHGQPMHVTWVCDDCYADSSRPVKWLTNQDLIEIRQRVAREWNERREFPTIFPHGYADEVARAVLAVLKEGGGR